MPECGIVVPVRNEAAMLPKTVPLLLAAARARAVIVWVCNGCTDTSAQVIRRLAGPSAEIVELARPGKTLALQAGDDALGDLFPRFYIDADTTLGEAELALLCAPLVAGTADLVAPLLRFDSTGASALSAAIGRCWMSLPHARTAAFSNVIGVSSAARARWEQWPAIIGDDIFVSAMVPPLRKLIVTAATATVAMPKTFDGWVTMRARWLKGEAQLAELGLAVPRAEGQRAALMRQLRDPAAAPGAWAFLAARCLGGLRPPAAGSHHWLPARSGALADPPDRRFRCW